jgi:tetratricopeptide (TPR) repeat protein
MRTPGPNDEVPLEPVLTTQEREELKCLAFHLAELDRLRDRGLIGEEAHATVVAEARARREGVERRGRWLAQMEAARRLKPHDPRAAVAWAERARASDPSRQEAWWLALDLRRRLGDHAEALALCEEAVGRFPAFAATLDELRGEAAARAARAAAAAAPADDTLTRAREALNRGDNDRVITLCDERLRGQPGDFDATVLLAFARQRLGQLDEALSLYRQLRELQPDNPVWGQWVTEIGRRVAARPGKPLAFIPKVPEPIAVSKPGLSWGAFAGEFLQDHWQKLILCLAVLLIVVSSNVGAYQLLGPKLWSPVGKCVLALVYTAMFAGFGVGLVRWGAERAGRIMLLTTLIVVPANFMLLGQMKLLTEPSPSRLAVLGLDAAALWVLIRVVTSALTPARGARFLSAALFVLSAFNAAVAPGSPWPWSLQFAVFQAPAVVFLGATVWLTTRFQAEPTEDHRETTYFALGLLTFAFLTGLFRTGVFGMELTPALYAVPVMLTGAACVHTARRLVRFDPDPRREAWMRFGGLVLSGLAFAMAMARPPGPAPLFSANTLATSLIGLILYAVMLWTLREPAYLYFGFGALVLASLGGRSLAHDLGFGLLRALEEMVRRALGYDRELPLPFLSIIGLVFSPVLAALSIFFRRVWRDDRLARHCHYLGVPFSVGACVLSGFEPKAAVICLSGYAVLYALAVRVFAAPQVTYLSTAALAGAVYFGSTLRPGTTPAGQALAGAVLGLGHWLLAALFRIRGVDASYRRPLDRGALALSALAVFGATFGATVSLLFPPGAVSLAATATFLVVGLTAALVNRDEPAWWLGYLAGVSGNVGLGLLSLYVGDRWLGGLTLAESGAAAAAIGLAGAVLGVWLRRIDESGPPSERLSVYPRPLYHAAGVQVALALLLCGLHAGRLADRLVTADFATMAAALGLAGAALAVLTRPYPVVALAQLTAACGLGVWVCLFRMALGAAFTGPGAYAAASSAYALGLIAVEEAARAFATKRKTADPDFGTAWVPGVDLFARALPDFEVGLVLAAVALAVTGLRNGPGLIATLAAGSTTVLWSTRLRRSTGLVDLGLALAVAAGLCTTAWRVGWADVGYGLAWLGLTSAAGSLALRVVARACSSRGALDLYVAPCLRASALLTWPVFVLALLGRIDSRRASLVSVAALGLNALVLVLLSLDRRRAAFTYRAVASAVFAVYVVIFTLDPSGADSVHVLGLAAVAQALVASAIGFACRERADDVNGWERLFARPLFRSALVLTALAVVAAHRSPSTMLLVAVSFLVMVKAIPSREWLYAAVASVASAVYFGVLADGPPGRLVTAAMVMAYQLWLVGLLVRRVGPALVGRLRLPGSGYDFPLFNSAAAFCAVAVALRVNETLAGALAWSDSAGLALNVAVFLLLMVKPYPHEGWVHGAVALASVSAGLAAYPSISSTLPWWLPLGMALAILWSLVARVLLRYKEPVCRRLGISEGGYFEVPDLWSLGFFLISTAMTVVVIVAMVLATLSGELRTLAPMATAEWAAFLLALALGGVYVVASWWETDRAGVAIGLEGLLALSVWWLAAPASPLVARYGMNPGSYLPLATTALALVTVAAGLGLARRPGWRGAFWRREPGAEPLARLDAFALQAGLGLAVLGVMMTRAEVNLATVATLLLATAATGLSAVARGWVTGGYAAGLTWSAAGLFAALEWARRAGVTSHPDQAVAVALGMLAALAVLWAVAGVLRRGEPGTDPIDAARLPAESVALALEQVALLAGVFAAGSVTTSAFAFEAPGRVAALGAVGALFGLALFAVGLIARWGAGWLVYAAQGSLLGGYLYYRWAFPLPAPTDAALLTLFGYLDLGLAEVMHRVGLQRFARPTRHFSLALPVLPLALGFFDGGLGGMRLFVLFTAATFYGIACLTMQWRSLGYASAVLYNAFLWLLWGRIGWTLADRPQFFLIPVGLSAILFAEVNRDSLGRQPVNTIRGLGLTLIYLSLAFPVWRFASLGAWLTLLLVSLAGILAGIGLRVQVFLWLGLVGFVLDVVYQLGRMGLEHTLAKWAIMLALGILLILFVALNEKKRIVPTMREYFDHARQWE